MSRLEKVIGASWLLGLAAVLTIQPAAASRVIAQERVGSSLVGTEDAYVVAKTIDIDEEAPGDLVLGAQQISLQDGARGDVTAAGEALHLTGPMQDDVHAAGSQVVIEGEVSDDVFVAGGIVVFGSNSVIKGNVYGAGQYLEFNGTVEGSVRAAGADIQINSDATIGGDLVTYGIEPTIAPEATIAGERRHIAGSEPRRGELLLNWVQSVLAWFIAAVALLWLSSRLAHRVIETVQKRSGWSTGIGLVWILLFLPITTLLLVNRLTFPIAIVIGAGSIALFVIAQAYAVLLVGHWVMTKVLRQGTAALTWQHALIGAVILKAFNWLGPIGWLISAALTVVVAGAVLLSSWRGLRQSKKATA